MTALFGKAGLSIAFIIAGVLGGQFLQSRVFAPRPAKPPQIDYNQVREIFTEELCKIPPPTVTVQPFECSKIKGLREFNYSPQYTGNIAVNGVDSAAVRRWIEQSVVRAFDKHVKNIKAEFVPGAITSPGGSLVGSWQLDGAVTSPGFNLVRFDTLFSIDPGMDGLSWKF
jgi:hypothetical protein